MLKIEVTDAGAKAIEKELNDVEEVAQKIEHTRPVRRVKRSFKKWGATEEVQAIEELDKKFLKSPQGQKLMKEWKEFGEALKTHVKQTPNGVHIDSEAVEIIEEEAEDIEEEMDDFKKSKWQKKYNRAWKKALKTPEAERLGKSLDKFGKSPQWHALEKELKELD